MKSTKRQIVLKIFFIFSVGCLYHNFGVIIIFIQEILDNPSLKSSKYKKTNSIEDFLNFQCGVCLNFLRWRLGYPLPRIMDLLPTVHTIQIKWSPTRTILFPNSFFNNITPRMKTIRDFHYHVDQIIKEYEIKQEMLLLTTFNQLGWFFIVNYELPFLSTTLQNIKKSSSQLTWEKIHWEESWLLWPYH